METQIKRELSGLYSLWGCGTMYTSNESWNKEEVKKFWKRSEADFAGDVSSPEIIRLSKKYIRNTILDVGAGSGALINLIPNAIGLDLVPKHPRMIKGDILDMPFGDEVFDTIFATEILEHLDDETLNKGLDEIYRVLHRGGHLVITVPYNEDMKQNMVVCPKCGARFHRWGHMQVFDEKRMREMLERRGFEIAKIKRLPIGFMAEHKFIKQFKFFLKRFRFLSSGNLFVVAVKTK
ncbi:SAM-dependent methyltransferase [Methanophagales archaeon]|nr:MAG: SAM-dependent methyltransferase [Methanophagales archaeon]